ncbi:M23 family metallopeptidase [Macrococcus brunensis]|uniref:lysostaphin n=1 Tax=Macrococcus brunensis TaxID=198483 RepID=A0A4R6BG85_9STAP|nr:peptidoglycan DD-metalloendopeptidase family protein [Macrococcus brunensis]TDL98894.1 M23 family metallopeptidase [Macrococcus brunensis]
MKKLMAASALGVGFALYSAGGYDVQADEIVHEAVKGYSYEYGSYYTKDMQGDYHHTKDGKWDQSMFDDKEWYFYLTDRNNKKHYFYFPKSELKMFIPDNNYSASQSYQSIEKEGYDITQPSRNVNMTQIPTSVNVNEEKTEQPVAERHTNVSPSAQSYNESAARPTTQTLNTASTQANATQPQSQASSSQKTAETAQTDNAKATSSWLKSYSKMQPYGQYYGGGAHYGVDYDMPVNTPVYSLTDGTVIQAGWSNYGGGNQVTIKEANSNYYQWYMHMNSLNVSAGQSVSAGQQIGLSGSTGNSTAPHLHFQRMAGGVGNEYSVDPTNYVNQQ